MQLFPCLSRRAATYLCTAISFVVATIIILIPTYFIIQATQKPQQSGFTPSSSPSSPSTPNNNKEEKATNVLNERSPQYGDLNDTFNTFMNPSHHPSSYSTSNNPSYLSAYSSALAADSSTMADIMTLTATPSPTISMPTADCYADPSKCPLTYYSIAPPPTTAMQTSVAPPPMAPAIRPTGVPGSRREEVCVRGHLNCYRLRSGAVGSSSSGIPGLMIAGVGFGVGVSLLVLG
ncbi:hypothetical protein MMC12_000717 [Toensbergia leucococca]|nr:hypothetical protein [Toensbergia leucococca]